MEEQLTVKEKVHIKLKRNGKTMQWLADQLGITRPTLYTRLEKGFQYHEYAKLKDLGIL
jgi:DNA-binding CsgD family transcriptional regulator